MSPRLGRGPTAGTYPQMYGLYELVGELILHDVHLEQRVFDITTKTVFDGAALAADLAPYDTGALKNSILASPIIQRSSQIGGVHGEYGSHQHYAPYQEYGTSNGIKPKWFMRRSFDRVSKPYDRAISKLGGLE